jgi:zinc transport system substrate-binding protein
VIAGFAINGQEAFAGTLMPNVLVTVAPLKSITEELLKGIGHVSLLTHPGQDAHTMALSPSQARALNEADIILMPDRGMNPVIDKLVKAREERGATVIVLSELVEGEVLTYPTKQPWLTKKRADNKESDETAEPAADEASAAESKSDKAPMNDPHIWMDPIRMANLAPAIAESIAEVAPSERAALMENAKRLKTHLQDELAPLLQSILKNRSAMSDFQTRAYIPFISSHRGYQYFLQRFDIADGGAIFTRPEDSLGAGSMKDILERAEKVSIHCIIAEGNSPLVQKIAAASGARVVLLSPERMVPAANLPAIPQLKNDYDRLLYVTAREFSGCL